jgi:hypothetical protein
VAKAPDGFVPLKSLTQAAPTDTQAALEEIRRIYFKTTKQTVENDLAHAIELLKTLETDEQRDKAAVFMEGIAQMRAEWARERKKKSTKSDRPRK